MTSFNTISGTVEHLSLAEAQELIPEERQPYVTVFQALTTQKARLLDIKRALCKVAVAHEADMLDPPLSAALAEGVVRARDTVGTRVPGMNDEARRSIGITTLQAVYDHGYRRR